MELSPGKHNLVLEHLDIWYFISKHRLKLEPGLNYYLIKAQPFGHKVKRIKEIPENPDRVLVEKDIALTEYITSPKQQDKPSLHEE